MPWTDILTIGCLIYLACRGCIRGFLESLFGPLALIITSVVSIIYFYSTRNLAVSLAIGLLGPFLISWILKAALHAWNKSKIIPNHEIRISLISRIMGCLISVTWGFIMIAITALLLVVIPPFNGTIVKVNKDIHSSLLYVCIKPFDIMADNEKNKNAPKLTTEQRMESLSKDPRIQSIVTDKDINDAINRKDYAFLMSHPKLMAIMQDPALLKSMLSLHKDLPAEQKQLPK